MTKLCLIVPDLNKGGMERVMSELANYFSVKPNIQVALVLLTNRSSIFFKISEEIILYKPGFRFNNKLRIISTLRTLFFLRKTLKAMQPDAVLSFGETYNSFVLLSCLFLKLRVFVSDRSRPDKKWGYFHETLRRYLYPRAAGIVAQTSFSKDFLLKETGQVNIKVIPNPVREFRFYSDGKRNVILNVGRIIKSKRLDLLINIFSECTYDGWELWLIGDDEGGEKESLVGLAKKFGIADRVRFWGKQEDMDRFYREARIFAFTSESEGLPNVLLEAMSAGLACISFDCVAGPRDLIRDGENGFLVKMYESKEYVSKLNSLIQNPELREEFSLQAKLCAKELKIEIIGDRYLKFLLS